MTLSDTCSARSGRPVAIQLESEQLLAVHAGPPILPGLFFDADLGWRAFLAAHGVTGAVISYIRDGCNAGRQAFLVGFEAARTDRPLAQSLIGYAEYIWQQGAASSFWQSRVSEQTHANRQKGGNQDAMRLIEPYDHLAVARHVEPEARMQALFLRSTAEGAFSPECRLSLSRVLPLFIQSAGAFVAARHEERRAAQLEAMFDKVSMATMLVDANGRPIFCNDAARKLLDERKWLVQGSDGLIGCANPAYCKPFRNAVRSVATVGDIVPTDAVLRLDNEDGEWRLAFIVPAVSRFRDETSRCAMVLIHAPARTDASAELLSALGLLPSEQRFLNSFLRANSLSEAAMDTGVSDETARTYLKRVRAKLGVHRQMDLAGLISRLVPPIRQRSPASAR
ncbi:PAS domain-containing protein [Sphingobium sp.]|uniref:PAS domain-containing protein n=1 Tax=Sphingobium sp. TaxID=1912891 RepID=UPI002BE17FE2|nr:PAS domain-containing protein [Sphingobium sp.]HUD90808.1 PAS domain-containing protein [Sphingobium sp.]